MTLRQDGGDGKEVRAIVAEVYGAGNATVHSVGWGNNRIWKIEHPRGHDYLKQYLTGVDAYRRELWALGAMKGKFPVPEVLLAREDDGTGRPFVLTRGIVGVPLDKVVDGRVPLVAHMGEILARLHQLGDELQPFPLFVCPQPGPSLTDLKETMDAELARTLDLTQLQAAMKVLMEPQRPVLVFRDFGDFQCLVAEGQIVGVVDWETVSVGDPEADLAFAGAFLRTFRVPREEAAFLAGYRRVCRVQPDANLYENLIQLFLISLHALWRARGQVFEVGRARRALLQSGGAGNRR